jgi:DNA-binding PadR family transcriptional regulator
MAKRRNDILQGTLALLVLQTLTVRGPLHGYAITAAIEGTSAELLRVEEGSLYPALHRMEQQGWLKSKWGPTRAVKLASTRSRARGVHNWPENGRPGLG